MQVITSRDMGFCFGVRRAVDKMKDAANEGRQVTTLGQVVHNPQVVSELKEIGIEVNERRETDGVTTDASTPDFSIDAVVARIEEIAKD